MAGGLAAIGLVAATVVTVKEYEEEAADKEAEQADTAEVASDVTAQAIVQSMIALLGAVATMPGGPKGALGIGRMLGRNWALVLLLVLIGGLFWPAERGSAAAQANASDRSDDLDTVPGSDGSVPRELRH